MNTWEDDMNVWEDQMDVYQDAQEDRQRAISGAEGMLKISEKFSFIYGSSRCRVVDQHGPDRCCVVVAILFFQKRKDVV